MVLRPNSSHNSGFEHVFGYGRCCITVHEYPSRSNCRGTLVFLHGRFGEASQWGTLIELIGPHYRCFTLDLPGFGDSYCLSGHAVSLPETVKLTQQLVEWLDEPVTLVGHDVGGAIAQLCALAKPGRVNGVVLINSLCVMSPCRDIPIGYRFSVRRRLRALLRAATRMDDELRDFLTSKWVSSAVRESVLQSIQAFQYSWPAPRQRETLRQELENLRQPAMLLWGAQDSLNPPENAYEMLRTIPEVYFFERDDCGHWPFLEAPEWVALRMREFLFRIFYPEALAG